MPTLREALNDAMHGWKQSLPTAWKSVFKSVTLDADSVPDKLKYLKSKPVFPVLRPPRPKGSLAHAHTFRAFKNIKPNDVRVVIVGQDPYPNPRDATGQSFEQGGISDWVADSKKVAKSLRPILRHAAFTVTGDQRYRQSGGWGRFIKAIENEDISLAPPRELFDCYNQQGVIWLNTTFTLTEFKKPIQMAHFAYWEPFFQQFLRHVASRQTNKVVFALWGGWAQKFIPDIKRYAEESGTTKNVKLALTCHPNAMKPSFMKDFTPLTMVNNSLKSLGEDPVNWLPRS